MSLNLQTASSGFTKKFRGKFAFVVNNALRHSNFLNNCEHKPEMKVQERKNY